MKKLLPLFFLCTIVVVAQKGGSKTTFPDNATIHMWQQFDVNRINATISSAGPYADYLKTYSSGLEWPKGSGKTAIFTAGMWIIGKHRPTGGLRTAVMDYTTEYQSGPINSTFNTLTNDSSVAADPNDLKFRVYKINKGDNASNNQDYAQWPADLGAPYHDNNKNGVWDPETDRPRLIGDQTLWTVYNDLNTPARRSSGMTNPLGIEVHASYFGYDSFELLRNIMFIRWRIINKNDAAYDSVYIGMWDDIDLGDANDDLVGSDPFFDLIYTYNGDNDDYGITGYGMQPPACGFMFLQGPMVPGGPDDSARFENRFIHGFRNLRSTASIAIMKSYQPYQDPPLGNVLFSLHAHNFMRGVDAKGSPIINPHTQDTTTFMFSGDPVTGTGWLQTDLLPPRDNRSIISSGPFTLAEGDTQEIIGAFVIAQGIDRLHSITELRRTAEAARMAYRNGFQPAPTGSVTRIAETDSTVTVKFTASVGNIPAAYSRISVYSPDTLGFFTKLFMFDDGSGDDAAANDGIFTKIFTVQRSPHPHTIDLTIFEVTKSNRWNQISRFNTTSIRAVDPVIHSDNLNNDGAVNAGETVRFGLSIKNTTHFTHYAVTLSAEVNSASRTLRFAQIEPSGTVTSTYVNDDPASFLSFTVPLNYKQNTYTVHLAIADSFGNQWRDSVVFPVTKIQPNVPIVQQTSGKSNARFEIVVTNPSAVKNHLYEIYGIDVIGHPSLTTYGIKDSATGMVLAEQVPAVLSQNDSPSLPEYDGFKVLITSIETRVTVSEEFSGPYAKWFSPAIIFDTNGTYSTVHYSDVPDIRVRFSVPLGYTDVNTNGKFDPGEPYVTDSTNAAGSQRAHFYRQESGLPATMHYIGYIPVPFTVHDVSGETERQLTVVVNDRDKNSQWDAVPQNSTARNTIYVFSETYDPSGAQYDSTKGGIDLSHSLRSNVPLPLYYRLDMISVAGIEPLKSAGPWDVRNSHPFSSRDRFVFNPTVLTGIPAGRSTPAAFSLEQNFPNPFNPHTTIQYTLPERMHVRLSVYNILGQHVTTVVNDVRNGGFHSVQWNGKNDLGISVASGLYFYHITAGQFTAARKMLMIR
jgi:hypothetical protein